MSSVRHQKRRCFWVADGSAVWWHRLRIPDLLQASIDREPCGLARSTLSKVRNIMSLIYVDAQRKKLIPDDMKDRFQQAQKLLPATARSSDSTQEEHECQRKYTIDSLVVESADLIEDLSD